MLWRSLQIVESSQSFFHEPLLKFVGLSKFVMLCIDFSEIEDKQSRIAWQRVNEMSSRESIAKTKLKAASQEEQIHFR